MGANASEADDRCAPSTWPQHVTGAPTDPWDPSVFKWRFQVKQQQPMELIRAPRRDPFITPEVSSESTCWVITPQVEFLTHMHHFLRGSETRPIHADVRGSVLPGCERRPWWMDASSPGPEHRVMPGYLSRPVSDTSPSGSVRVFASLRLSA